MTLDVSAIRDQFPALTREVNGRPAAYLDGPAGTQVPQRVIDAMSAYMAAGGSNDGGSFTASRATVAVVQAARKGMMALLNARRPEEIAFGQNMTSLTFAFSRALAKAWRAGDNIVVTRLDHDANIAPWLYAAEEHGVEVRWLDINAADGTLALHQLPQLLDDRTRLVAVTHASNALGSITDIKRVVQLAHDAGALVFVDSVHYTPHGLVDVQALDCDFLACSAYKFFGPHTGILYGKYAHLERLPAYKVRPAPEKPPGKWQTGTQSFECLAGVAAAVDHIAAIGGDDGTLRERLVRAATDVGAYERALSERFLRGATAVPGLRVFGITDIERLDERAPTFAVDLAGHAPREVAARLGEQGIFVWHGNYYALAVMERLQRQETGGLVRIGFVHYNTVDEVDRALDALTALAGEPQA